MPSTPSPPTRRSCRHTRAGSRPRGEPPRASRPARRGARLLEQARHQATELTNATRAEVEQTLEWARAQGASIMHRAQQGAEQLLRAAGLGDDAIGQVASAIVRAVEQSGEHPSRPAEAVAAPPLSAAPTTPSEPEAPGSAPAESHEPEPVQPA